MCYPKEFKGDEVVAKFPEREPFGMDLPLQAINEMISIEQFYVHVTRVSADRESLRPSRDPRRTSRAMAKLLFDFRSLIDQRMLRPGLKSLYKEAVDNERRHELYINEMIEEIEAIRLEVVERRREAQTIRLDPNTIGYYAQYFLEIANRFHQLSSRLIRKSRLYCKSQAKLYHRFLKKLLATDYIPRLRGF